MSKEYYKNPKKIEVSINCGLTERQIVELSKQDFKNYKNSIEVINWHLDQLFKNGYDKTYFNILRQNLLKGIELSSVSMLPDDDDMTNNETEICGFCDNVCDNNKVTLCTSCQSENNI